MSYIEKIYYNLNTAFSLNFMVLQNLERILPSDKHIYTSDDIFGKKSFAMQDYEFYYEELADIRNEHFNRIRNFFSPEIKFEQFKKDSQFLLNLYNEKLKKNISYLDIFSERNIKIWEVFSDIFNNVENFVGKNSLDTLKLQFAFAQFLTSYDEYKDWLSAFEIFEVLEDDITPRGSKSLYFGNSNNPDIFKLKYDDYHIYSKQISNFISNKKIQKKDNQNSLTESISLDTIINFYNKLESRFTYANSHLMEHGSFLSKIQYKLSTRSDGDFEIKEVYIHRNEILTLISAMENFPELNELANQISLHFFNKNVVFYQNNQKENI